MLKESTVTNDANTSGKPHGLNWWVFLWACVGFIVYGSLFPFNFQPDPKPLTQFYSDWHMLRSVSDASDNFLLFVPLGIALDACFRTRSARFLAGIVALLLLGVGVQLLQLYLPSRISAMSDVLWNAVGLAVGVMLFARVRHALARLTRRAGGQTDSYAMLLVVIWFVYESFPFLPTLDIGLLRAHIKPAVMAPPFEAMRWLQHGLAATLAGVAMWRANWLQPRWLNVLIPGALAVFMEIFVAYGSLRRETMLGIVCGLFAGYLLSAKAAKQTPVVVIAVAFSALLITVLTPYRGQPAGASFTWTPFSYLIWWGNTKDISPSAFEALAIGAAFWFRTLIKDNSRISGVAWTSSLFSLLLIFEIVRVFVVGYRGDTTLFVMAILMASFFMTIKRSESDHLSIPEDPTEKDGIHLKNPNVTHEPSESISTFNNQKNAQTDYHENVAKYNSNWIDVIYSLAVLIFSVYIVTAGYAASTQTPWLAFWGIGILPLVFAPRYPVVGIVIYLVLGYGISSHGPQYDISLALRLRDGIALFAIAAWFIAKHKARSPFHVLKTVPFTAIVFFAWLMLTALIAWSRGTPLGPILRFDPSTYVHAAIMLFLVADLIREKSHHVALALLIIFTVLGRALLQGLDGIYLESYVATLLTVSLPIAGIGILVPKQMPIKILSGAIFVAMLILLAATQNRNSAVAFLIMLVFFIIQLRLTWMKKVIVLCAMATILVLATPSQYYNRFSALWDHETSQSSTSLDRATAQSRIELWGTAWEISKDYPIFGVGPGNFAHNLKFYSPSQGRLGAHNSYLQALAETGFIGLALYVTLFISAYLLLRQIKMNRRATWQADIASMLQLSLIAYLALGLFNNRNDLVLAYIVAGWAVALKLSFKSPFTGYTDALRADKSAIETRRQPHGGPYHTI